MQRSLHRWFTIDKKITTGFLKTEDYEAAENDLIEELGCIRELV